MIGNVTYDLLNSKYSKPPITASSPAEVWSILISKSSRFRFFPFLNRGILFILHAIAKKNGQ